MNCIFTHQPLRTSLDSQRNTSISRHDIMLPPHQKLLSLKMLDAVSADLLLDERFHLHQQRGVKRMSKSSYCLNHLTQEAYVLAKKPDASLSMSKLRSCVSPDDSNPLAHNAVFHHPPSKPVTTPLHRRRRPMALKLRNQIFDENPRRKELLLDNTGSLNRRMEEFRKQKKAARYIHIIDDSDSDEGDLE